MKCLVKYNSDKSLQIKSSHIENKANVYHSKHIHSKRINYPIYLRGRQLIPIHKICFFTNEVNNISTRSTCETKQNVIKQTSPKLKKRYNIRKMNSISSSSIDNSDNDSISSYEIRKRRFLDEDNSFVYPTRREFGVG